MSHTLPPAPSGQVARRELQFFWIADHSSSMHGAKIASLNQSIREAVPEIRKAVQSHPEVRVVMRCIRFSSNADWHVGPMAVPLENFAWHDLADDGTTATHKAIDLLSSELDVSKMPLRGLPPVCILISDGACDDQALYQAAIQKMTSMPWGTKSVRLAVGIRDRESEYRQDELMKFLSHPEVGVLDADSPSKLAAQIKWASVAATVASSDGKSRVDATGNQHLIIPGNKPTFQLTSAADLF